MVALLCFLFSSGTIPQYHIDKQFADRRYKVQSARTYFYLNEAQCERNLEIFHECLEAVSGKSKKHHLLCPHTAILFSAGHFGLPATSCVMSVVLALNLEVQAITRVGGPKW